MNKILLVLIVALLVSCQGIIGPDGTHYKDGYISFEGILVDKDGNPIN